MIEIRGQDGSKVVGLGLDSSDTVLGRGRGLHTLDRTVSRDHLILKFEPRRPASLSFEVTGRNPLWVLSRKSGQVRVCRNSDKGRVDVGDGFCVSGKEPFWFFLEEECRVEASAAGDGGGGGEVDISRESEMDDRLEVDVSGINPVKEFGFLVVGHEFDSYPNQVLREVKDWDWFLEEPSKERDNSEGGSDEARSRRGRRRKRKRKKAKDDDTMEEDEEWTGESEEDEEALRKANKVKKGVYWTGSRDPVKPAKNVSSIIASSSMQKKSADRAEVKVEEEEEDDDESLGGFIVDDDDAEPEEESNDREDEEDEFIYDEEIRQLCNIMLVGPQAIEVKGLTCSSYNKCKFMMILHL